MSGKQMEGDNERRRALARQARAEGRQPSEAGVTLGASKQVEHVERAHRDGPPPAGSHKPRPEDGGPAPTGSAPAEPSWPRWDPEELGVPTQEPPPVIRYRDLVAEVGRRTGLEFDLARRAAESTITVLAWTLDGTDRRRLLDAVPTELHDDYPTEPASTDSDPAPDPPTDLPSFVREVARLAHRTPEQARYQAQVVLNAVAERNSGLIESMALPVDIRELIAPPPTGGGLVDSTGHTAPLTDDELAEALARLPLWSGTRAALSRTISLPPDSLDRVLRRLERLRRELGRGPHVGRQNYDGTAGFGTAVIVVRTSSVNAVTVLDVELAHRIDEAIDEAAAGMA
jgi:hypothetical protein